MRARSWLVFAFVIPSAAAAQSSTAPAGSIGPTPSAPSPIPIPYPNVTGLRTQIGAVKLQPIERAASDLGAVLRREAALAARRGVKFDPAAAPAVQRALRTYLVQYATGSGERGERVLEDAATLAAAVQHDDLSQRAQSIEAVEAVVRRLRELVVELRDRATDRAATYPHTIVHEVVHVGQQGAVVSSVSESVANRDELVAATDRIQREIEGMQRMLDSMKFDLQRMYQDFTQSVAALTGLIRDQHDTLQAILGNLRD